MIIIQTVCSLTLLKEHGFLLISGIVQETIKGSHCQRPYVESKKIRKY